MLETTRKFKQSLDQCKKTLEEDFNDDEIETYLDPDFVEDLAEDFANDLYLDITKLSNACDNVV